MRGGALTERTLLDMLWAESGGGWFVETIKAGVIEGGLYGGEGEGGCMAECDGLVDDGDVEGDRGGVERGEGALDGAHTAAGGEIGAVEVQEGLPGAV